MMSQSEVDAAFEALGRPGLRLIATADAEQMSVVLAADASGTEWLVFVDHREGVNTVDQIVGGSGTEAGVARTAVSADPQVIQNLHSAGHGDSRLLTERPTIGWQAVTGIAALDAVRVRVETSMDSTVVDVAPDGRFLALLRGPWGRSLALTVLTTDGREVPVGP